ncbi:DNA polymerase III subunit gamma/tau [Avibacterium paragallinarum]|uniref:DNA polymerase III subunit gamma/tau n=1 Tax=Avibacterium paragallinarum TaxID=728 RepID=A0A8B3TCS2_AVIPA|nr:DNA polymerase III subunit gamma/tau [Avibacterium paragallinarum]RZN59049.1 DNA polymerase III subunit gamma/tau [Avibacterium paragallinarum]
MSYQVLARKWRPQKFSDVVGQKPVLTALANGLNENRLHHAYLFSGTRGVGKTSIARLFAKGLNCVNGVTAEPCGVCEHCKAIEEGRFIDLIEIDAASRTKVEDTRELLDNVQYKPVQGRYKVYLIDEVHMLSRHSFNALLKTLEEPPEYVKFLLATTDPQKLPVTILSRCIQFHLKALDQQQIADHLEFILQQEKIPFDRLAIEKLAKAAQGSIRDSLSLTDQAIAMSNGNISLEAVNTMLGLLDDNQPIEILYALQQGNGEALMKAIQAVADNGGDWLELLKAVAETLHQIAMCQLLPQPQISDESHIGFLAKHISPEDVQFFYQIIVIGQKELAFAPNQRMGTEMVLLRALAFHPKLINIASVVDSQVNSSSRTENSTATSSTINGSVQNTAGKKAAEINGVGKSAVENHGKLVEMPVVSPAGIAQRGKTPQPINPQHATTAMPQATTIPSPIEPSSVQSLGNPALDALNALDQLSSTPIQEKKNAEPQLDIAAISLPVVERKFTRAKPQAVSQEKATPVAMTTPVNPPRNQSAVENSDDFSSDNENEEDINLDENYRWNWRNPEMAKDQESASPSEIRKAILDNSTPELKEKILTMAKAQDKWTETIEQLGISGLLKQMAMNSFILQQDETQLTLGLAQDKLHLNNEKLQTQLQNALSQFYGKEIHLSVETSPHSTQLTPMEHRKKIYLELSQQARNALQHDEKLQRFCEEFNGILELENIRPV